jgi:hypothetical protein
MEVLFTSLDNLFGSSMPQQSLTFYNIFVLWWLLNSSIRNPVASGSGRSLKIKYHAGNPEADLEKPACSKP